MPNYIIKLTDQDNDYYLIWSTVVDAPLSYGMGIDDFRSFYITEFGTQSIAELNERLQRIDKTGCSGYPPFDNLDDLLSHNRAGDNGGHLSKEEILQRFCIEYQQS